jgi:hypothetical protein
LSHVFARLHWQADFERALAFYEALMSLLSIAQRFCDRSRPWAGGQMPGQARPLFLVGAPIEGEHADTCTCSLRIYALFDRCSKLRNVHSKRSSSGFRPKRLPAALLHQKCHLN